MAETCLFTTRTSQPEHTVNHSHELSTFAHSLECIMPRYTRPIHSAPCLKKTVQNCFCHKFVECLPNLIILGTRIAQRIGLREVHSFSTSPNLRLGEVENECTSHKLILSAISVPKIITVSGNLTNLREKQFCTVF